MKVLISQSGDMISTIHSLSFAKLLKNKFPNSKIVYLVSPQSSDLLLNHPYVDEFFVYHRNSSFYFKIKEILNIFRVVKPTHYFYLGGGYLPNFISWLLMVSFRGGYKSRWSTFLFLNKGIRQKRSMVTMHELEYNLNLLSSLGIDYAHRDRDLFLPEIHLPSSEVDSHFGIFKKKLISEGLVPDRKIIFLHPNMANNTLNWSSRNYARLMLKLDQLYPSRFLYIVAIDSNELNFLQGLKEILNRKENEKLKEQTYFLTIDDVGLRYYLSILKNSLLFIGPNNSSVHFASMFGVPSVSLYSPIKNFSALRWGPLPFDKKASKVLVPDVICGEHKKCAMKDCPYYECMGKIEVEDVVKQSLKLINFSN